MVILNSYKNTVLNFCLHKRFLWSFYKGWRIGFFKPITHTWSMKQIRRAYACLDMHQNRNGYEYRHRNFPRIYRPFHKLRHECHSLHKINLLMKENDMSAVSSSSFAIPYIFRTEVSYNKFSCRTHYIPRNPNFIHHYEKWL